MILKQYQTNILNFCYEITAVILLLSILVFSLCVCLSFKYPAAYFYRRDCRGIIIMAYTFFPLLPPQYGDKELPALVPQKISRL